MGQDVIHLVAVVTEIADGILDLLLRRAFLPPPMLFLDMVFKILAVPAAEGEIGILFNGVDLPAHQMKQIFGELVDGAAVPFRDRVFFEKVEILMASVKKADTVGE